MKKRILNVHGSYMAHNTIIIKTHLNMVLEDRWFATYGSIHLTRSLTGHKSFRRLSPEIFTVNKLRNTYRWYWISSSANNISVQKYTYVRTCTLVYKISTLNVTKVLSRRISLISVSKLKIDRKERWYTTITGWLDTFGSCKSSTNETGTNIPQ